MPPATPPSSGSRRRHNVSQACINCRQRKKKCDGKQPICGTCATYKDDCVWESKTDWRKSVSRTEANALRARVSELERMLTESRPPSVMRDDEPPQQQFQQPRPPQPLQPQFQPQPQPVRPPLGPGAVHNKSTDTIMGLSGRSFNEPDTMMWTDDQPSQSPTASFTGTIGDPPLTGIVSNPTPSSMSERQEDLDGFLVQDNRGRLRVHAPSSAYRQGFRQENAPEPTTQASPSVRDRRASFPNRERAFGRYLPDIYLTRTQHDTVVDRFFRYFASWAQRATPHLFFRDMEIALWTESEEDLPLDAPNYSPLLHNMILAVGLAFADEEHLRALSTRRVFSAEATKHMDRECANPCVATVQGLAIRSSFESTMGDYSLGWVNQGLANRLCYALGLHVSAEPLLKRGKVNREVVVQRNVTFWTVYCQEGMWAIYIGRKPMVQDYSLPLPTTDEATDDTMWKWPPGPRSHLPPQKSYLSLAFVQTAHLMQIATDITRTIYTGRADKSSLVESGTVQRFSDELDRWLDALPVPLSVNPRTDNPALPHTLMVHLAWAWSVILLYQPFSQVVSRVRDEVMPGPYQNTGTVAMTRCHQAALKIVQLATIWDAQHGLRFTPPTLTAIIYSAGTCFLLAAAQAPMPAQGAASLQKVHSCLGFLEAIGQTWEAGRQQAVILRELLSECARASLELPAFMGDVSRGWTRPHTPEAAVAGGAAQQPDSAANFFPSSLADDSTFDAFIQTLLNQSTVPIAAQAADLSGTFTDWSGGGNVAGGN